MSQDAILGYFHLSMDYSRFAAATQDLRPGTFSVVPHGTARASLLNPGLTSWATLSRPYGTDRDLPDSSFVFNYYYPNRSSRKANLAAVPET
jgi:hypothetical protein